jgi:hypothetical protein
MPRFIATLAALLFVVLAGSLAAGCVRPVTSCDEFDAPPDKTASACPPKPQAVQAQPAQPARYCYSSLAQADCYAEPQPGRPGYMGSSVAPTPAAAPAAKPAEGKAAAGEHAAHGASATAAAPAAATPAPAPASATPAPAATGAPTPLAPAATPAN